MVTPAEEDAEMLRRLPTPFRGMVVTCALAWQVLAARTPMFAAELRVMSYNILVGGHGLGQPLEKTAEVIAASAADIIGLQEQGGSTAALADLLGFEYRVQNNDISFLSRYPIAESLPSGVRIELPQGEDAYLFNVHLAPYPYQPYDIRNGEITTEAQAIAAAEATRGNAIRNVLGTMRPYVDSGAPIFLVGDFNEPSHLDWTQEAADAGLNFGLKVAYPTSRAVADTGLTDAFRAVRPDEVSDRGDTWTPLMSPGEVHDRIDIVYHAGLSVAPLNAYIVGESAAHADIVVEDYPSDHRAVVGRYELLNVGGIVVRVDRGSGAVTVRNESDATVAFDGYTLTSAAGMLDPADGAWRSLADAGIGAWQEANPTPFRLSELDPLGALSLAAGESIALGRPYGFVPAEFGDRYVEDVRFRYFTPEGDALLAAIEYAGWRNNMVLTVDPATGEAVLENQSPFDLHIDTYRIASASGSLDPENWTSFEERSIDHWFEANPSAHALAELNPLAASLIPSGARIRLGALFDPLGLRDLKLTFLFDGESTPRSGLVSYEHFTTGCPAGDADGNCLVDIEDLNAVRNQLGSRGIGLAGDTNFDGLVDLDDLNQVRNHFGEGEGAQPMPEPASMWLLAFGALAAIALPQRLPWHPDRPGLNQFRA